MQSDGPCKFEDRINLDYAWIAVLYSSLLTEVSEGECFRWIALQLLACEHVQWAGADAHMLQSLLGTTL